VRSQRLVAEQRQRAGEAPEAPVQRLQVRLYQPLHALVVALGLLHHQAEQLGAGGREAHVLADPRPGHVDRVVGAERGQACHETRLQQAEDVVGRGAPQRLLAAEVVGDEALVGARPPRDLAGAGPAEALLGERAGGGLDDALAGGGALLLALGHGPTLFS
jgi:hypothetical protein